MVNSWDPQVTKAALERLQTSFASLQECLKALFVEIRINLLQLRDGDKLIYREYCEISFKGTKIPTLPIKIEQRIFEHFQDDYMSIENTYFSADLKISEPFGEYTISNHLICYSTMLSYYYKQLELIILKIPQAKTNDELLTSMDSGRNTVNQKILVLHYLQQDKKISLLKISQDATKQAKLFSFLFDNSYDNLRKGLGKLRQTHLVEIKTEQNLKVVSELFLSLGSDYKQINALIKNDLNPGLKTTKKLG